MKKTTKLAWSLCMILLACALLFTACGDEAGVEATTTVTDRNDNETLLPPQFGEPENPGDIHTHEFGEWITVKDSTCTELGEQQRTCDCGIASKQARVCR